MSTEPADGSRDGQVVPLRARDAGTEVRTAETARPALGDRLAVIVIASGMGPVPPGERFHSGRRADNLYWWLARRQASWLLNPLYRLSANMVLRSARGDPQRFTQGMARHLPEADRRTTQRLLARPGAQAALIEDLREATGRAPPP
jgi:hypothetical protein